jgi:transcriptional regulator with XRE-family HTH domain
MGKKIDLGVAFGIALRKLRISMDLTQEQLGFEAGLRRTYISSLELGQKMPSLETLHKLSTVFNMPISKFLQFVEVELKR